MASYKNRYDVNHMKILIRSNSLFCENSLLYQTTPLNDTKYSTCVLGVHVFKQETKSSHCLNGTQLAVHKRSVPRKCKAFPGVYKSLTTTSLCTAILNLAKLRRYFFFLLFLPMAQRHRNCRRNKPEHFLYRVTN